MPADPRRRDAIATAVATYDRAAEGPLPRNATRLLSVMFSAEDVCHQSLEALAAEGFDRKTLPTMLRRLEAVGLLTRQRGSASVPDTYQLHLPALVQS